TLEPGPDLHGWLSMLDPSHLGEAQVIEAGVAWERQRRHDASIELALLQRLESLPILIPDHLEPQMDLNSMQIGPMRFAADVRGARVDAYATATGQSPVTVSGKAAQASLLQPGGTLSATGDLLRAGELSAVRAAVIAAALAELSAEDAAAVESSILRSAELMSSVRLRRELEQRKAELHPKTEQEQHVEARARRGVSRPMPLAAGMAFLEVLGPAEDVHLLHTALTAMACGAADAERASARKAAARGSGPATAGEGAIAGIEGIDAHRFDALIGLAAAALHDDSLPRRQGRRPAIGITMALSTLLGLDDAPAMLEGYGPITAEAARRAAADPTGTMQRLITRPDGLVVDASYTSYRPPAALCDTVIARDRHCTYPRCTRAALVCDLDHRDSWPCGDTCYLNLQCLCRHHHNDKTAGRIFARYDAESGDTVWSDAYGRQTRRPAERHRQPDPRPPDTDTDTDTEAGNGNGNGNGKGNGAIEAIRPASGALPRLLRDRVPPADPIVADYKGGRQEQADDPPPF
ncbi:MAG: hypothetical protein JWN20_2708, partial [Jatrophihabitantaceae bacterium]|nr:hypothetical protein [Jatrophihabitantaceae bacterium]